MGYEVHITHTDDWASNEDCAIEPSEWRNVVDGDKSLRRAGYHGPHFAIWDRDPTRATIRCGRCAPARRSAEAPASVRERSILMESQKTGFLMRQQGLP